MVQSEDFNCQQEVDRIRAVSTDTGAIVTFTGLVRELYDGIEVTSLFLEHYPGMTEKSLQDIADKASQRWPLLACRVIHRVGKLDPGEQIVFVGISSLHRRDSFEACQFIMDYLKTKAPFWKKQVSSKGEVWVESKVSDYQAANKW